MRRLFLGLLLVGATWGQGAQALMISQKIAAASSPISFVISQTVSPADDGLGDTTTAAIDSSACTPGCLGVIGRATYDTRSPGAISDSKGNTCTQMSQYQSTNLTLDMFFCPNMTVGSGHTFTSATGGLLNYISLCIALFKNTNTSAPRESQQTGNHNNAGSPITPGAFTPAHANDLVVAVAAVPNTVTSNTAISGFTIPSPGQTDQNAQSDEACTIAYQIQTTATSVNASASNSTATEMVVSQEAFKQ